MTLRWRPPLFLVGVALLALIAVLATLQYRWVSRISDAERDRVRAALSTGASQFAHDVDRELTRAYLLFQSDPLTPTAVNRDEAFALRYDRWHATSQFPRLIKDYYIFTSDEARSSPRLERFDPGTRRLRPAEWPASMSGWRTHLQDDSTENAPGAGTLFIRRLAAPVWRDVPAIVVPQPTLVLSDINGPRHATPALSYCIITIDLEYLTQDLFPSLAARHVSGTVAGGDYQVAVVSQEGDGRVLYRSTPGFSPGKDETADASAEFFQVRTADFTTLAAEVRRFATFTANARAAPGEDRRVLLHDSRPVSILVQAGAAPDPESRRTIQTAARITAASAPAWRVVLRHPAGSLETAVNAARRRNLVLSSGILAVLGASMGLLVLSTRRAQRLARQQMEFVAAVSHELRTPLAVIRSAAENLADGVVHEQAHIRQYGDLMRTEGRRLTEMVEQILELAGIQSGQRGFAAAPVHLDELLRDLIASSATLLEEAKLTVEVDLPRDLPAAAGDRGALRRVFQNLLANAIKYGASGRWIGIRGGSTGDDVQITIADRGIGIAAAEQARIFEPFYRASDVVSAQVQGAGLGLSLVRRIVEAHGGRVTLRSTPGSGSEFTVHLRAAGEAAMSRTVDPGVVAGAQAPRSP